MPAKDAAPAELNFEKKKKIKKRFSKPTVPCRVFSPSVSVLQLLLSPAASLDISCFSYIP